MRKLLSAVVAGGLLAAFTLPVLAQGTGPQSGKPDEAWDMASQSCKAKPKN